MTLWLALALMTAAAVFAVLWPLGRQRGPLDLGHDLVVYRDQLREIDRDEAEGTIGRAEAEKARAEVSRRLIAAADAQSVLPAEAPRAVRLKARRIVAVVALVALPAVAAGLYLRLGSPGLPGQPLRERVSADPARQSIAAMVARIEAHLADHPEDGRGWEVLAPVYLRLGRYEEAVKARRNAVRLLGATAAREADLGEALVSHANGIVTAEAKAAFERAVRIEPDHFKARYYLGLAAEQDGQRAEAARIWRAMLAQAPDDAPWLPLVREALARLGETAETRGPTAKDRAAAANLSADERERMVRDMVERLGARLRENGSDVEGWLRLVRAYMVLGEPGKARAAAADARRALAGEPDKLRRLEDGFKGLGLEG